MVCPINVIAVFDKPWFFILLPMVFSLFRKMSGGFRYFTVPEYCSTKLFVSSRHIVNAVHYSIYSIEWCRKEPFEKYLPPKHGSGGQKTIVNGQLRYE